MDHSQQPPRSNLLIVEPAEGSFKKFNPLVSENNLSVERENNDPKSTIILYQKAIITRVVRMVV